MFECRACIAKDAELARALEREKALLTQIAQLQHALSPKDIPAPRLPDDPAQKRTVVSRGTTVPAFAGALLRGGHVASISSVGPQRELLSLRGKV